MITINPIDLILIILSGLTAIFTVFLCVMGLLAILGWNNMKDFEKKQRAILIKQKTVAEEGMVEIKSTRESAQKLLKEFEEEKMKIKSPSDFEKYEKKMEELAEKLDRSIERAQDKISNLKLSDTSGSVTIEAPHYFDSEYYKRASRPFSASLFEKECSQCGKTYTEEDGSRFGSLYSECPHCGHLNVN